MLQMLIIHTFLVLWKPYHIINANLLLWVNNLLNDCCSRRWSNLQVDSYASFLYFMSHLFLLWCVASGVNMALHSGGGINPWCSGCFCGFQTWLYLTTCVHFISLKLDFSCHLHVKCPLLLDCNATMNYFCYLYLVECLLWIWCTQQMVQRWWVLSDLSSTTKGLSPLGCADSWSTSWF